MNREAVLSQYEVNEIGVIVSPGKFEGEMLYVPALWGRCLEGFSDTQGDRWYGVEFGDEERAEFPEIASAYGLLMEESDTGFVFTAEHESKEEYDAAVAAAEKADADEALEDEYAEEEPEPKSQTGVADF